LLFTVHEQEQFKHSETVCRLFRSNRSNWNKNFWIPRCAEPRKSLGLCWQTILLEFASSGRAYDKKQVLYQLRKQLSGQLAIEEFRVIEIMPSVALVRYRA
jgi:hypothetical protein